MGRSMSLTRTGLIYNKEKTSTELKLAISSCSSIIHVISNIAVISMIRSASNVTAVPRTLWHLIVSPLKIQVGILREEKL